MNRTGFDFHINGAGIISPQPTCIGGAFPSETIRYDGPVMTCILPDFKAYMNPFQMRRLSRMLRMGLAASVICLKDAGIETPDAIITATGYGFQENMGKFLTEILEQDEQQLTPTYFMQSTHNALSGLIALSLRCLGYNSTYAGKGYAFETALLDALMLLEEGEAHNVLVGSFDEVFHVLVREYTRMGYLKQGHVNSLRLFESRTEGTLQGEGVAFFLVSRLALPQSWCRVRPPRTVHGPVDDQTLTAALINFLTENGMTTEQVDVFVNGAGGDIFKDRWINDVQQNLFGHAAHVRFKHLTGEYATASSFALWLGALILKNQTIPEAVLAAQTSIRHLQSVLVCNHFFGRRYAFFLLTKP